MSRKGCGSCRFVKYEVSSKGIVKRVYCDNEISERYRMPIEEYGDCPQYEEPRWQRTKERKTNLQRIKKI